MCFSSFLECKLYKTENDIRTEILQISENVSNLGVSDCNLCKFVKLFNFKPDCSPMDNGQKE